MSLARFMRLARAWTGFAKETGLLRMSSQCIENQRILQLIHSNRLADGPAMSPDTRRATFQLYTVVKVATAAKIPENKSFSEACVLPIAFNTALVALCGPSGKGFGLPFPTLDSKPSENTLIIWGASSAVGLWSLQLARAAGVKAVAVASEHNHTLCKSVGAAAVVDYRKPSVIEGIVQAVKTIGGDFVGIFDCVSDPETSFKSCMRVMEQLGGGTYGNIQPHIDPKVPDNVKATTILGISEMTHAFWQGFIAPALEHGRLRCLPEALVAGEGLESLQKGLNMLRKGVSAKKVVVTLN